MKRGSRPAAKAPAVKTPKASEQFTTKALTRILEAAHLGGAIDELVLVVKDGVGIISAVDKTSCAFVLIEGPVGEIPNATLGLKEVGFFIKAISSAGSEKIDFLVEDGRWFRIKMQGAGDVKVLLASSPDMIPTAIMEYEEPVQNMRDAAPHRVELAKEACERFLYFQDLVKNTTTVVKIFGGSMTVGSGQYETRTFTVEMGSVEFEGDGEDFSIAVFGDFMKEIFKLLDWSEEAPIPVMWVGPAAPVIIEQGEGFFWTLSPSSEGN